MRIISKFKDYYDYLQGIYGVDEKKVLDRTMAVQPTYLSDMLILSFCNNIYYRYEKNYWDKEVEPLMAEGARYKYWHIWNLPKGYKEWEVVYTDDNIVWINAHRKVKEDIGYAYALLYNNDSVQYPYASLKD